MSENSDQFDSVEAAEAAIRAEVTGEPATAGAPQTDTASAAATESAPPQTEQVKLADTGDAAPKTTTAEAPQDLASVVAQMVRREAENAAREQAMRAAQPPPAPQYRDTLSAAELRTSPIEAFRAAGIDPSQIAPYIIAELAPHAATPEARARLQMAPELHAIREQSSRDVQALRQELESMRAQERAREYERSLQKFSSGVSTESYPLIGRLAKDDPSALAEELFAVAQEDARAKYLAGESGPPMTPEQAARVLEQRYASYQRRLGLAATPPPNSTASAGTPVSAKPAPAATISSMSGAPPVRTAAKTLEEIEREIYNESVQLANNAALGR